VRGLDHDYEPGGKVTPVGFLLPDQDELSIAVCTSKVTSDCIVDAFDHWWNENKTRFPDIDTLVLLQDNGPANSGRRTQFLSRMVNFVATHHVNVRLAYYPPYHSKYNPVERCWGILEHHWSATLLNSVETTVEWAKTMTWKGLHPMVELVETVYQKGVRVSKKMFKAIADRIDRCSSLPKYLMTIQPQGI